MNEWLKVLISFILGGLIVYAKEVIVKRFYKSYGAHIMREERAKQKLISTEQNIVGQIENAFYKGICSNFQHSDNLFIETRSGLIRKVSARTVSVFEYKRLDSILEVTVTCDFKNKQVCIVSNLPNTEAISTRDPNDLKLATFISDHNKYLGNWSYK